MAADEQPAAPPPEPAIVAAPKPNRAATEFPWRLLYTGLILLGLFAAYGAMRKYVLAPIIPPASTSRLVVAPGPNVLIAIRDLARLETCAFHMERVVELNDEQTHLFGLIQARDALLLVAAGDVIAGIDLADLREGDVQADWPHKRVRIVLPAAAIFGSALDSSLTRVFSRTTDHLALRREDLEERARREAEATMRRGAIESGILQRARAGGERAIRSLMRSMGFEEVQIEWRPSSGDDTGRPPRAS